MAVPSEPHAMTDDQSGHQHVDPLLSDGNLLARAFGKAVKQVEKQGKKVLEASRDTRKRRKLGEEVDSHKEKRAKIRRQIYMRGRMKVPEPGESVSHDQQERDLRKTAARGVVRFFNMVAESKKKGKNKFNRKKLRKLVKKSRASDAEQPGSKKNPVIHGEKKASTEWEVLKDSYTGVEGESRNWGEDNSEEDERSQESEQDAGSGTSSSDEEEEGEMELLSDETPSDED